MDRCGGPSDPAVDSVLRQPGWLIDESPVALRPVLADGLPFREANLRCLSGRVPGTLSAPARVEPVGGADPGAGRQSGRPDSNRRPFGPKPNALPGWATPRWDRR